MTNTDCTDLILNSQGCMAIARLLVDILDKALPDRLNETGTCEICGRSLPYAWRVIELSTGKEWEADISSDLAKKCQRSDFEYYKFLAFPNYYCETALERWCRLDHNELDQLKSEYVLKDRQYCKNFTNSKQELFSPIDIAYALTAKRKFDAMNTFVRLEPTKSAPMDSLR